MMTEHDRLRSLQVGVARHDGLAVLRRLVGDHLDERHDQLFDGRDLFFEIELDVQRHLIVAAARGVQALAVVADALGQLALDKGVDVLGFHVDLQRAGFDVGKNAAQALNDVGAALLADDAAPAEHGRVGDAALDVLAVHAAVKGDGGVEIVGGF